jgi:hypothetical protein
MTEVQDYFKESRIWNLDGSMYMEFEFYGEPITGTAAVHGLKTPQGRTLETLQLTIDGRVCGLLMSSDAKASQILRSFRDQINAMDHQELVDLVSQRRISEWMRELGASVS